MKHVHRYERVILGKNNYVVFRCNLPDCNHYIRRELANGKQCLCNRCHNVMILDKRAMHLQKPHCVDCIVTKKERNEKILGFLEANDFSSAKNDN